MKFRSLLCSVLASTMVIGSCVCANAATFTAGSENATAGGVVSVPITVAPSAGETSTDVNAYAIAISYDSSVLTPVVKGTDEVGDNTYATVGDSFNSGVLYIAGLSYIAVGIDQNNIIFPAVNYISGIPAYFSHLIARLSRARFARYAHSPHIASLARSRIHGKFKNFQ